MLQSKVQRILFPLFGLCLFALSMGQFSVIYRFNGGSIYLFDILIALFDSMGITYLLLIRKPTKIPLPTLFLLVFCALGAASLIFTPLNLEPEEFLTSVSYLVRYFSYVLFATLAWNLTRHRVFQTQKLHRIIIYSGLLLFVAGLLQLFFLPDLETLDPSLGWDPHKNRMASTFFDPNFLGIYFIICLATTLKYKARSVKYSPINFLPTIIFLAGILLTFSRSAWLAAAVLLLFALLRRKFLLLISLAIVLMAVFAIPRIQTRISGITDPQDSASYRLQSWQNTWEIAKENWVFGVGYNTFRYAQKDLGFLNDSNLTARSSAGSDSSLLLVLATTGVFGMLFFMGFFISTLLPAFKRADLITAGLILSLLIDSLFINSLFYPQIAAVMFLLIPNEADVC